MKRTIPFLITLIKQGSLVKQIIAGLVLGILVALAFPGFAQGCGVLGSFFVSALKAVAPVLVFVLVAASIANQESTTNTAMKDVIVLYLVGTFLAALVAVFASFLFPTQIALIDTKDALSAPGGIGEVVKNLIFNIVDNPVKAIANANYIGILAWSISLGVALRYASDETKRIVTDLTASVEYVVRFVIRLAPIGVFGLVAEVVATTGLAGMMSYVRLLAVLIGCMIFIALIVNPLLVFLYTHKNPYPLVWACLRESGVTAFFTRSSAANIPVNMNLCRKLGLDEKLYSLSIPIGATINMDGTAGERSQACRDFAALLEQKSGLPVVLWDERGTTVTAARYLNVTDTRGKKRKKVIDAVAATIILESYLVWRKNHREEGE